MENLVLATGTRKTAVARVRLKLGDGKILVNGRAPLEYFCLQNLVTYALEPLNQLKMNGRFDVMATVCGGGLSGQAGALRLALARALVKYDPQLRPVLKSGDFLRRDPRMVERKKYGRVKARKRFQFSKR